MPKKSKTSKRDPDAIQIETLARRYGKLKGIATKEAYPTVRKLLNKAGVQTLSGKPLYIKEKVSLKAAEKALGGETPAPSPPSSSTEALEAFKRAGAEAQQTVPIPAPQGTGSMIPTLEGDPVDEAALIESARQDGGGFPAVPNLPKDLIHLWVNRDPRRVTHHGQKGWRAPTDPRLLKQWDPSGLLLKKRGPDGCVYHDDTVLMVLPARVWQQWQQQRESLHSDRASQVVEDFFANVEAAQKLLQDQHGLKGDEHLSAFEMESDEIASRAARARRQGRRTSSIGVRTS